MENNTTPVGGNEVVNPNTGMSGKTLLPFGTVITDGGGDPVKKAGSTTGVKQMPFGTVPYQEKITEKTHGFIKQTKYDYDLYPSDVSNIENIRADRQGFLKEAGNAIIQTDSEVILGSIKGIYMIPDVIRAVFSENGLASLADEDFSNDYVKQLEGLMEGVTEEFDIYKHEGNPVLSSEFFTSGMPSVGSSATILIPMAGWARGAGMIAKWLSRGATAMTKLPLMGAKSLQLIEAGAGALYGNLHETYMGLEESLPMYKQQIQAAHPDWSDQQIMESLKEFSNEYYMKNLPNAALDMIGFYSIMRPFGASRNVMTGSRILPGMGKVLDADGKVISKAFNAGSLGKEIIPEGVQEAWNYFNDQKLQREVEFINGARGDDDYSIGEWLSDPGTYESAFWGAAGGGIFMGAGNAFNQIKENTQDGKFFGGITKAAFSGMTTSERATMIEQQEELRNIYADIAKMDKVASIAEFNGNKELYDRAKDRITINYAVGSMKKGTYASFLDFIGKAEANLKELQQQDPENQDVQGLLDELNDKKELLKSAEKHYGKAVMLYGLHGQDVTDYTMTNFEIEELTRKIEKTEGYRDELFNADSHGVLKASYNKNVGPLIDKAAEVLAKPVDEVTEKELQDISDQIVSERSKVKAVSDQAEIDIARMSIKRKSLEKKASDIAKGKVSRDKRAELEVMKKDPMAYAFMYGMKGSAGFYDKINDEIMMEGISDLVDNAQIGHTIERISGGEDPLAITDEIARKDEPVNPLVHNALRKQRDFIKDSVFQKAKEDSLTEDITEQNAYTRSNSLFEARTPVDDDELAIRLMPPSNPENDIAVDTIDKLSEGYGIDADIAKARLNDLRNEYDKARQIDERLAGMKVGEKVRRAKRDADTIAKEMFAKEVNGLSKQLDSVEDALNEGATADNDINTAQIGVMALQGFLQNDKKYDASLFADSKVKLTAIEERLKELTKKNEEIGRNIEAKQKAAHKRFVDGLSDAIAKVVPGFQSSDIVEISKKVQELKARKDDVLKNVNENLEQAGKNMLALYVESIGRDAGNAIQVMPVRKVTPEIISNNPEIFMYNLLNHPSMRPLRHGRTPEQATKLILSEVGLQFDDKNNVFKAEYDKLYPGMIEAYENARAYRTLKTLLTTENTLEKTIGLEVSVLDTSSSVQPFQEQESALRNAIMLLGDPEVKGIQVQGTAGTGKTMVVARKVTKELQANGTEKKRILAASPNAEVTKKLNQACFNEDGQKVDIFLMENIQTLRNLLNDVDYFVIDEVGLLPSANASKVGLDTIKDMIDEINKTRSADQKKLKHIFLGDPQQLKAEAYTPSLSMASKDPFTTHIVPPLTIQQRTANTNIESFYRVFRDAGTANAMTSGKINQIHDKNKSWGADTEKDINIFLQEALSRSKKNDQKSRAIIIDDERKLKEVQGLGLPVYTLEGKGSLPGTQGLDFDEVFIYMDYNPESGTDYTYSNQMWYTAISRAKRYALAYHPTLPKLQENQFAGDGETSSKEQIERFNQNRERYITELERLRKGLGLAGEIKTVKTKEEAKQTVEDHQNKENAEEVYNTENVLDDEDLNTNDAFDTIDKVDETQDDALVQKDEAIDSKAVMEAAKIHTSYKGIKGYEGPQDRVEPGDDVRVFTAWEPTDSGKDVLTKVYLVQKNGKWVQVAIQDAEGLSRTNAIRLMERYSNEEIDQAIADGKTYTNTKVSTVGLMKYIWDHNQKQSPKNIIPKIQEKLRSMFLKNGDEGDIKFSYFLATDKKVSNLLKNMKVPADFNFKSGKAYYLAEMPAKKGENPKIQAIEWDNAILDPNTEKGANELYTLKTFYNDKNALQEIFSGMDFPFRWGDDSDSGITATYSVRVSGDVTLERSVDLNNHRIFCAALEYEEINGEYKAAAKDAHFGAVADLYKKINESEDKSKIIALIDKVRTALFEVGQDKYSVVSDIVVLDKSRNKHAIASNSDKTFLSDDNAEMFSTQITDLLSQSDTDFVVVNRSNKDKTRVLRTTVEVEGLDSTKRKQIYQIKTDYILEKKDGLYVLGEGGPEVSVFRIDPSDYNKGIVGRSYSKKDGNRVFNNSFGLVGTGSAANDILNQSAVEAQVVEFLKQGNTKKNNGPAQIALNRIAKANKRLYVAPRGESKDGVHIHLRHESVTRDDDSSTKKQSYAMRLMNNTYCTLPLYKRGATKDDGDSQLEGESLNYEKLFDILFGGAPINDGFGLRSNISRFLIDQVNENESAFTDEINQRIETGFKDIIESYITFGDIQEPAATEKVSDPVTPEGTPVVAEKKWSLRGRHNKVVSTDTSNEETTKNIINCK